MYHKNIIFIFFASVIFSTFASAAMKRSGSEDLPLTLLKKQKKITQVIPEATEIIPEDGPVYIAQVVGVKNRIWNQTSCSRDGCFYSSGKKKVMERHWQLHDLKNSNPAKSILCCGTCCFLSEKLSNFNRHMATHKRSSYPCEYCRMIYKSSDNLELHVAEKHPEK